MVSSFLIEGLKGDSAIQPKKCFLEEVKRILKYISLTKYAITLAFSVVTGQPFDDPGGRWRAGGGINVPLKIRLQMTKTKAKQLTRSLNQIGIQNTLKETDD